MQSSKIGTSDQATNIPLESKEPQMLASRKYVDGNFAELSDNNPEFYYVSLQLFRYPEQYGYHT